MLFAAVGLAFLGLFLHGLTGPDFRHPATVSDWFATLGFSLALFAIAAALPMFGRMFDELRIRRVSFVPAVGAALGGASNVLEDGLQLDWAFWFFVSSAGLVVVGLAALSIAIALLGRGSDRLLAAFPRRRSSDSSYSPSEADSSWPPHGLRARGFRPGERGCSPPPDPAERSCRSPDPQRAGGPARRCV